MQALSPTIRMQSWGAVTHRSQQNRIRLFAGSPPLQRSAKVALTVVIIVFSGDEVSLFPSQLVAVE